MLKFFERKTKAQKRLKWFTTQKKKQASTIRSFISVIGLIRLNILRMLKAVKINHLILAQVLVNGFEQKPDLCDDTFFEFKIYRLL